MFLKERWDTEENKDMSGMDILKLSTTMFIFLLAANVSHYDDVSGFAELVKNTILAQGNLDKANEDKKFEAWLKQNLN